MRAGLGEVSPAGFQRCLKYLIITTKTTAPNVTAANTHVAKKPGCAHLQHKPAFF